MATKYYLDQAGVELLSEKLLNTVNNRIAERIIQNISDDDAATDRVPSTAAVLNLVNKMSHVSLKSYTGRIEDINKTDVKTNVIYLQRDSEEDETWTMYIYDGDLEDWIDIGTTDVNLSDYWSKSETDELKEELDVPEPMQDTDIISAVETATNKTKADLTPIKLEPIVLDNITGQDLSKNGSGGYSVTIDVKEELESKKFNTLGDSKPSNVIYEIDHTDFKVTPSIFDINLTEGTLTVTVSSDNAGKIDSMGSSALVGYVYITVKSDNYHNMSVTIQIAKAVG